MQSVTKRGKIAETDSVHQPDVQGPSLLDMPTELLLRITSLLAPSSIRNLMVSRTLRLICERHLYRCILLPEDPQRSRRLLETFVLRPDLALLVQYLDIDLSWIKKLGQSQPLYALSLAKNVHSLRLWCDWVDDHALSGLREVVFNMKLRRLEIPLLCDEPGPECSCMMPADGPGISEEILTVLRAQPLLEWLSLPSADLEHYTFNSLKRKLQKSDIPNVRFLEVEPDLATAFLPVTTCLESLSLTIGGWDEERFSQLEIASEPVKCSVRRLAIRTWPACDGQTWIWNNLAKVFGLFPSVEDLSVTVNSTISMPSPPPANYYFSKIADSAVHLPSLRTLGFSYETNQLEGHDILDVDETSLAELKITSPLLRSVVDPKQRLWTFVPDSQTPNGYRPHLEGLLRTRYIKHWKAVFNH